MHSDDLREMTTATAMARALARGEMTASRLAEAAVERAGRAEAAAVLITVTDRRARLQAEASDRRAVRGARRSALDGVPIAWKDVFDVQGSVTTRGSASHLHDEPAAVDSHLVRRAHNSGLVTIGKTNLSEFAFSGLGINTSFGTPTNPCGAELVPGGSSSGSAVAVARGLVALAVGTDTSGSVRVPAALCGVVGYRASTGRYGPHDFAPLSETLDSVGVFATTVEDLIALDRVLVPARTGGRTSPPRFVVPVGEWSEDTAPEIADDFDAVVDRFRAAGAEVRFRQLPSLSTAQRLLDGHGTIVGAEAYRLHRHRLDSRMPIEAATRRRLESNARTADSIGPLYAAMSALRAGFAAELDGATLLCPTVRHIPPRTADLLADPTRYDAANAAVLRTTMVLSYLGTCGISVPAPAVRSGPPTGILLSRTSGDDSALLEYAAWAQGSLDSSLDVLG
ncbi:amidase family protein [Nocardia cyriacigeorgica]|uniref:amidase family protein n=1 Tax=Nocardia cyriacigeorgica TaxID=135487 RepID=UPI0024585650|nr:amidase family protein [Nocardia cyriacigeorgica]